MATVLSQVLDQLDVVLKASLPVGTGVFQDRVDAESQREAPSVNVLAHDDAIEPFSGEMDRHEQVIELRFLVRQDASPTKAAEALHLAVHAAVVNDSVLAGLCVSRRVIQASFERLEADETALVKSAHYRFTFLIPQDTL